MSERQADAQRGRLGRVRVGLGTECAWGECVSAVVTVFTRQPAERTHWPLYVISGSSSVTCNPTKQVPFQARTRHSRASKRHEW